MSDQTINVERLRALMLQHLHVEVPSADIDLLDSGLLDSLQLVDLLLLIEEHFGRRIPIEAIDLEDLRTLTRLARLLNTPAAAATSAPKTGRTATGPDECRDGLPARPGSTPRG
jgi:acyl carrier protein